VNRHLNKSVQIFPLSSADMADVAALQPEGWGDILPSIRFYCTSEFCHPLKATLDGKLVGIGTAIVHHSSAWLAHIIVHNDYRNAGIGTTITKSLIDLLSKTRCNTLFLLATALGEPVYRKFGFVAEAQYMFLDHGTLPSLTAETNLTLFDLKYYDSLLRFDQKVSGENREKLINAHLTGIRLFLEEKEIIGYYIPTLGEGPIVARDAHAGTELMKYRWMTTKTFCLPTNNEQGIHFLQRHGYQECRHASRMILGRKISWDGRQMYSRIGGNLG
jgi:GNAT superfamily N-acetyltransferase